jgi:hypothetical protein
VECGSSARNYALELEEKSVGITGKLMRARDKKLRLCGERSTATRRWRPEEARGRRGARARGDQGRGKRSGSRGDDAWACVAAGGGAWGPAPAVSSGGRSRGQRGKRRWSEEDETGRCQGDLFVISKKIQGPLCKLEFLTATKVK